MNIFHNILYFYVTISLAALVFSEIAFRVSPSTFDNLQLIIEEDEEYKFSIWTVIRVGCLIPIINCIILYLSISTVIYNR